MSYHFPYKSRASAILRIKLTPFFLSFSKREQTQVFPKTMPSNNELEEIEVPVLEDDSADQRLARKVWVESKKLWHIVGPSIFSRLATYSMSVVTIAFAGHLGDLELAAISIANNVIVAFNFGLLVRN